MVTINPAKIPSYCKHLASGQAVVRLNGRDHYLGKFGSAARIKALRPAPCRIPGRRLSHPRQGGRRPDHL